MTARSASAALMPLDEAVRLLLAAVSPVAPRTIQVEAAIGAIPADDVRAADALPSRAEALRDGWAVNAGAIVGASPYAPVTLARAAEWVEAGDALSAETDTILPPDAIEAGEIVADAPLGDGVRRRGDEIGRGDRLAMAGRPLSPVEALALLAAGVREIAVRVPRIRVVATGSPAASEALSMAMQAWIAATSASAVETLCVADDAAQIAEAIAAEGVDAVLVLGGTGFGRTDASAAALARAGTLSMHGVALRPGETAGFGFVRDRPVLLVPGRPDASLAVFLALARPLLARLAGTAMPPAGSAEAIVAPLLRKVSSAIGLSEIVFVCRTPDGVEPLGGADLPLRRLVLADGAILAPPGLEGYPEGTFVEIMPL